MNLSQPSSESADASPVGGWLARAARALQPLVGWITKHPHALATAVASSLVFGGSAAFAVAQLAPDPADLPVRQITEAVTPLDLSPQLQALEQHRWQLHRSEVLRATDTAETLLRRLGAQDAAAAQFLRSNAQANRTLLGRPGRTVHAVLSDDMTVQRLTARWAHDDNGQFQRMVVERTPDGFVARLESGALQASQRLASGVIDSSLFAATDAARLPDAVAVQLAEVFSGDIDFHRALRKGDRFSVVYEALEADGEPLRAGRVLSAEFVNKGRTYQAMWFQEPAVGGAAPRGGYYTFEGDSLRKQYLASPMEFSRVSSGFKMRFHPILQRWRAHLGVDYAAPTGTPVRTVGDGVVEFAGVQGGFGNVVFIRHRNNHTTVYAHLSRIGVRKGQSVTQGQHIGAVGATGWATGPHLHFEFRVNGVHQDPLTIARINESVPLSPQARPAFASAAQTMRQTLAAASSLQWARAE